MTPGDLVSTREQATGVYYLPQTTAPGESRPLSNQTLRSDRYAQPWTVALVLGFEGSWVQLLIPGWGIRWSRGCNWWRIG